MGADRLGSADEFLERSAAMLAEPAAVPAALSACAWCSHPLDDTSPSGEFCGERCAAYWRAGCDWDPEERCVCRVCAPQWHQYAERIEIAGSPARGLFQVMPGTAYLDRAREWAREQAGRPYRWPSDDRGVLGANIPEVTVDISAVERALADVEHALADVQCRIRADAQEMTRWATEHFRRRWFVGVDAAREGSTVAFATYDADGNLVVRTDLGPGWEDLGTVDADPGVTFSRGAEPTHVIVDEVYDWSRFDRWFGTRVADAEVPTTRWTGRKPNRRRRKRRS